MDKKSNSDQIDESLYSRQLYVIGEGAMTKMKNSDIFISGMSGLGVEIAKNIILSGVRSVTLHDEGILTINDLSCNYYATKDDIGRKCVDVVKDKLSNLNPYVKVDVCDDPLTPELIKSSTTVVLCNMLPLQYSKLNNFCRLNQIKFIVASTMGVLGSIFCDFGDNFIVSDIDGEESKSGVIINIDGSLLTTSEPHQLECGDIVQLNLEGQVYDEEVIKVNNLESFTVKGSYNDKKNDYILDSSFEQKKRTKKHKIQQH